MKLTQFLKREFQSLGMSRQETAFVITLSIMLCILVSFIIVRVNNKPEEIWLEVPSTEEITKLLEEQEKLEDPQTEEDKPADSNYPRLQRSRFTYKTSRGSRDLG